MNKNVRINNGLKRFIPMHEVPQHRDIKSASTPNTASVASGNELNPTPEEIKTLKAIRSMSEAKRKAKIAKRFANRHKRYGDVVFTSAWNEGGPHCLLATLAPFDAEMSKLAVASTVGVAEHIAHIASELRKMGMIKMPYRRDIRGVKKYLNMVLEQYTHEFYPLATGLTMYRLTQDTSMDEAIKIFHAVIETLHTDLSSHVISNNMAPIMKIMLRHTHSNVDKADVCKFISTYAPLAPKPNILGRKLKGRLTEKAKEAIQSSAPGPIASQVAFVTTLQTLPSPHGEAA